MLSEQEIDEAMREYLEEERAEVERVLKRCANRLLKRDVLKREVARLRARGGTSSTLEIWEHSFGKANEFQAKAFEHALAQPSSASVVDALRGEAAARHHDGDSLLESIGDLLPADHSVTTHRYHDTVVIRLERSILCRIS